MESEKVKGVVCFFNSCKAWGGGEKWHLEMACRLRDKGLRVLLCASPGSPLYKKGIEENLDVYPFKIGNLSFLNLFLYYELNRFFRAKKVTHLIMNMSSDVKAAGRAAKKAGVGNIIYRRGSAIPIKNSTSNRYLFRKVITRIIANSEETRRTILANNPDIFEKEKIHVIYNGIDLSEVYNEGIKKEENKEKNIVLGNAGRLEKQKHQKFLIELVSRLHQKGYKVKLKIAGTGRLENELKTTVDRLGLNSFVEFIGFTDNIKRFLSSVDIFVLSSLWEGFGFVLVEAHACGKPVIAFDVSSNPEIVNNGEDGILVPPGDMEAFAGAVEKMINNPELRRKMGNKGKEKVFNKFDIEITTQKLIEFLTGLER